MTPIVLRKLTSVQVAHETKIRGIRKRLKAKSRDTLNRNIVQTRLDTVKEIWAEARKTNSEIIVRDDTEADVYVTENWFKHNQGVYEGALDEILTLLTIFERSDRDTNVSEIGSEPRVAKLPRIPLPTFSGKYKDWASFCDLFSSLVHNSLGLTDATKLQYLKLCLTDGAAELIKDMTTTNANYASTWKALKARYSNPRLIINRLLRSFMDIPYLKRESAADIRAFVDETQRIVHSLENLKLPVNHWDVWLVFVLADRLDVESWKLWEA